MTCFNGSVSATKSEHNAYVDKWSNDWRLPQTYKIETRIFTTPDLMDRSLCYCRYLVVLTMSIIKKRIAGYCFSMCNGYK